MPDVAASLLGPVGMVALRADLADGRVTAALGALGLALPGRVAIAGGLARGAAWMSPDELLLLLPPEEAKGAAERLGAGLAGLHHLALDVSDMRAAIAVDGPEAAVREVLAKLTPADTSPAAFPRGTFRRTRLGQVAAALWLEEDGARVLCFRSVGGYARRLLARSAADGAVGFYA